MILKLTHIKILNLHFMVLLNIYNSWQKKRVVEKPNNKLFLTFLLAIQKMTRLYVYNSMTN